MSHEGKAITGSAALLHEFGADAKFSIEQVVIDPPKGPEVRVKMHTAGLCHTDEHLRAGDYNLPWAPCLGGHEGAGVVVDVGPDVRSVGPGDHVVMTFIPSCGRCPECVRGRSAMCELGTHLFTGVSIHDQTNRIHWRGKGVGQALQVGTFAEYTVVHENSVIRIDPDLPLETAALVGCCVTTGIGAATYTTQTMPGDVAVVVGVGGIGMNAVQGFSIAGALHIVAVDPVGWKRNRAREVFGATHAVASMGEARELVSSLTRDRMADTVVYSVSNGVGEDIEQAMSILGKRGTMVYVSVADSKARDAKLDMFTLLHLEQRLVGSLFGSANPRFDIPRVLSLYRNDQVKLEELVTTRYTLDEINDGYDDLLAGKNIRGVISFD
ncbi:NDMA-dependent alcohol dehydrogenase [Rhodococcus sp. NPDC057529]|uniref:NDMA-dependent alcohol dehydrogenase n=1 Tax=Rhodococcus sp. NPDC057529 TaxID=3346158 RepID=UPI00366C90FB